jgi:hypothetical protein
MSTIEDVVVEIAEPEQKNVTSWSWMLPDGLLEWIAAHRTTCAIVPS